MLVELASPGGAALVAEAARGFWSINVVLERRYSTFGEDLVVGNELRVARGGCLKFCW